MGNKMGKIKSLHAKSKGKSQKAKGKRSALDSRNSERAQLSE
jgi:hypothetical protein